MVKKKLFNQKRLETNYQSDIHQNILKRKFAVRHFDVNNKLHGNKTADSTINSWMFREDIEFIFTKEDYLFLNFFTFILTYIFLNFKTDKSCCQISERSRGALTFCKQQQKKFMGFSSLRHMYSF